MKCITPQESYIALKEFNASQEASNQNGLDQKSPKPNMIGAVTIVAVYGLTTNFDTYKETLGTIIVSEEYSLPNQDALFYVSLVIAVAGAFSICIMIIVTRLVQGKVDVRKYILFAGVLPFFIISLFNQPMSGTKMNTHNCSKNSQGNYVFNLPNITYDDNVLSSNIIPIKYISNFESKMLKRQEESLKSHSLYISNQTRLIQNKDAKKILQRATGLENKSDGYFPSANYANRKLSNNTMIAISNNALHFDDDRHIEQYSQTNVTVFPNEFRLLLEHNAVPNASVDSCRGCPVVEQPWCAYTSYIPVVQMVLVYSLAVVPEAIIITIFQVIYAKILGESN